MSGNENVKFVKSKAATVTQDKDGNPVFNGVDTEGYKRYANTHDLVVLAVGMEPSRGQEQLPSGHRPQPRGLYRARDENGGVFAAGAHPTHWTSTALSSMPQARRCAPYRSSTA